MKSPLQTCYTLRTSFLLLQNILPSIPRSIPKSIPREGLTIGQCPILSTSSRGTGAAFLWFTCLLKKFMFESNTIFFIDNSLTAASDSIFLQNVNASSRIDREMQTAYTQHETWERYLKDASRKKNLFACDDDDYDDPPSYVPENGSWSIQVTRKYPSSKPSSKPAAASFSLAKLLVYWVLRQPIPCFFFYFTFSSFNSLCQSTLTCLVCSKSLLLAFKSQEEV